MPQMAPISWTILFLIFSLSFIFFNIINFYNKNFMNSNLETNNKNNLNKKMLFNNWKW